MAKRKIESDSESEAEEDSASEDEFSATEGMHADFQLEIRNFL